MAVCEQSGELHDYTVAMADAVPSAVEVNCVSQLIENWDVSVLTGIIS